MEVEARGTRRKGEQVHDNYKRFILNYNLVGSMSLPSRSLNFVLSWILDTAAADSLKQIIP